MLIAEGDGVGEDPRITYGEFRERAERLAAGLAAAGIGSATMVTWQLPSRIDSVLVSAALARLDAVQCPVLHLYREKELGFVMRHTGAQFVIVPGTWKGFDFAAMAQGLADQMEPAPVVLAVDALAEGDPSTLPGAPAHADGDEPVRWIYSTSGTTSDPKGVQHTDATLIAGGRGLADALEMTADDVGSIAFPYAHIAGPDYLVMMLLTGMSAAIVEAFIPADAIEFYRRNGVTMAGGATAFYQMFLAAQREQPGEPIIPTLRALSGGGAPLPPELFREVRDEMGINICHGYGMTEIPMITQGSPTDSEDQLAHTTGKPVTGAVVRIVAEDGTEAPQGSDGEVRVKGPMVTKGYTNPALTAEAFDEDGWFRTGDVGHLRADGHVVLTGRLKDIIIRKGENISAKEIEDLLYAHPKVGDVAVVGLPDRERGERVCAVVERPADGDAITFDEMVTYLGEQGLTRFKTPEQLEVVDSLPRNETLRKVLKYKLREELAQKTWP
uniref:Long-chain-fatty-acid--CoA ligase n=1 Tax=uncultured bacterium A1Q1_fos_568 TaxID=1256586 RepID=L7VQK0_9BACT|nr:long-chain-fatty-acid--CoA ligase [uncultured bacterium A1Q1_fos_568]